MRLFPSFLLSFLPLLSAFPDAQLQTRVKKAPSQSNDTFFHVTSGSNENYFLRNNVTSGQLLLTSNNASASTTRRLVAALPAGNNGALVYFLPTTEDTTSVPLNIELVNGTMKSTRAGFNNAGIQADVTFSANATLGVTIVGAVRALRDYVEGSGTMHEIFNYTLLSHSPREVRLHRRYINTTTSTESPLPINGNAKLPTDPQSQIYKSVDLYFSIPPGSSGRFSVIPGNGSSSSTPKIDFLFPSLDLNSHKGKADSQTVRVRVLSNETSLVGFDADRLFLTPDEATTPTLKTLLQNLPSTVADQFAFLTFQNKFTAGGWRFLTYFGRDSLIALRLLMPLLTPDAIEAALGAVIERANTTGALCHEETIGDYASFVNINNGRSDLGNAPFYDYKMIDTDLYLIPALKHYFLDLPQGQNRSASFFAKEATLQNGTYGDIANRIAAYNLNRALPFFLSPSPTHEDLLAFRPGQPVGQWRDSNEGTGYGPIPFDVNVALVPANLRATESLVEAGLFNISDLGIASGGQSPIDIGTVASKWESDAPGMFEVQVEADVAQQRLGDFVQQVGLNAALLDGQSTNGTGNVSFYALSLMQDGTPVEVLNSDLGFNLMFGSNVSSKFLGHVVDALTPYPRGLLTNVGMVVANPAYGSNRTNVHVLDRTAYHGTVVWSFQQALMAGGIARQLSFCTNTTITVDVNPPPTPKPQWCDDADLVQNLQAAQTRLWGSIQGASDNIYSEVWSYSFDNSTNMFSSADIATLSPVGTESDAIQLWSYGFLGLIAPM